MPAHSTNSICSTRSRLASARRTAAAAVPGSATGRRARQTRGGTSSTGRVAAKSRAAQPTPRHPLAPRAGRHERWRATRSRRQSTGVDARSSRNARFAAGCRSDRAPGPGQIRRLQRRERTRRGRRRLPAQRPTNGWPASADARRSTAARATREAMPSNRLAGRRYQTMRERSRRSTCCRVRPMQVAGLDAGVSATRRRGHESPARFGALAMMRAAAIDAIARTFLRPVDTDRPDRLASCSGGLIVAEHEAAMFERTPRANRPSRTNATSRRSCDCSTRWAVLRTAT